MFGGAAMDPLCDLLLFKGPVILVFQSKKSFGIAVSEQLLHNLISEGSSIQDEGKEFIKFIGSPTINSYTVCCPNWKGYYRDGDRSTVSLE